MAPPAGYCHRRECGARGSPRASGSRRTPLPCPLGARGAGFPGSPGRSWILLLAKAGSEFRTVIPGGVTSEKFFFFFGGDPSWGWETPAELEDQPASQPPPEQPTRPAAGGHSTSALTVEKFGWSQSDERREGNHVWRNLEKAALRHCPTESV